MEISHQPAIVARGGFGILKIMSNERPTAGNLTGSLLVAHPGLLDPNFRRTVLFLSHHSAEDGAVGLVLNRPLQRKFKEVVAKGTAPALGNVNLFYGGPVSTDSVTIASLQWRRDPMSVAFHSFDGEVDEIEPHWQPGLRAFVGYSGWTSGQLEREIAQKAWIVLSPTRELIEMNDPEQAWRGIMRNSGPRLRLLAEAPDDPELN